MDTSKRVARVGERIVITNSRLAWNGDRRSDGTIMNVIRSTKDGVYTEEIGLAIYVKHEGYEVIEE